MLPSRPLPARKTSEPILAYKTGSIIEPYWDKIRGVSAIYYYHDDNSICLKTATSNVCEKNDWLHRCGFHAFKNQTRCQAEAFKLNQIFTRRFLMFEVELYGKIVAHKHGYRASRQKIKKLFFPDYCLHDYRNNNPQISTTPPTCMNEPQLFMLDNTHLTAVCFDHLKKENQTWSKKQIEKMVRLPTCDSPKLINIEKKQYDNFTH